MTVVVFLLLQYAQLEYRRPDCPLRQYDAPGDMEAPALVIAKLLTGPALYPFVPFSDRLLWIAGVAVQIGFVVPVAALWFWIGLEIENRRRVETVRARRKWPGVLVSALLTLVCGLFAFLHIHELWQEWMLPWQSLFESLLHQNGFVWFLWSPALSNYPLLLWMIIGIVFFGLRAVKTVMSEPALENQPSR
jgi:hypothetical protein